MKHLGTRIIAKAISKVGGRKFVSDFIVRLAQNARINLYELSLNRMGILNYADQEVSGEKYFIQQFLKEYFDKNEISSPILFDVGANIGKYTRELYSIYPHAFIYTFEPNPNSFKIITENLKNVAGGNIRLFQIGLSAIDETKKLVTYADNVSSSHASLYGELFDELYHSSKLEIDVSFTSVDQFCKQQLISKINLLKIDTEGHELEVLRGAQEMINSGNIDIIQFEFGECHVYSRVFLKDFYTLLNGYELFRLRENNLYSLGEHSPINEIFRFQNIIALRRK